MYSRHESRDTHRHSILLRYMNEVCWVSKVSEGLLLPDILRTFQRVFFLEEEEERVISDSGRVVFLLKWPRGFTSNVDAWTM